VYVTKPAEQRCHHRGCQQVRRHHPAHRRRRGAELLTDVGQYRHHQRLQHGDEHHDEAQGG